MKKTKIVATIGPATRELKTIEELALAGLDVCRLNASFGTHQEHKKTIQTIRTASDNINKSIGLLMDLQGPKIRVGKLNNPVEVHNGDTIILSGNREHNEEKTIPTTYEKIASDTEDGKQILLADGHISLEVIKTKSSEKSVVCKVIKGGTIYTGKGINLPYTKISLQAMTEKDCLDAIFAMRQNVDYIGLSFVRKPQDLAPLKELMRREKRKIPIIAKIEKPEALDNLDAILDEVDGVMVARGDLAVELSFARVPVLQKEILHRANRKGKLTIVATEMLNSMIENPLPTRAEASDVANAVFDGTDAVMLSNETSIGKFPLLAVKAMNEIVTETEKSFNKDYYQQHKAQFPEIHELTDAMCASASFLASYLNEKAVIIISHNGGSAKNLSKYRPDSMIIAGTFNTDAFHRMALYHNVYPVLLDKELFKDEEVAENAVESMIYFVKNKKLVQKDDNLVFLTGNVKANGWKVNNIKVVKVT